MDRRHRGPQTYLAELDGAGMMVDLVVRHPRSREIERHYVYQQVLVEWLGLTIQSCVEDRDDVLLESPGSLGGPHVRLSDILLGLPSNLWLTPDSLPRSGPVILQGARELSARSLVDEVLLPWAPTEMPPTVRHLQDGSIHIGADLFGAAFFFLTRYEEVAAPAADRFGRYPAASSWSVQHGLIERPLVDEYLAVLRAALLIVWPKLPITEPESRVYVSHDVDLPLRYRWSSFVRTLGGGLRDCRRGGGVSSLLHRMRDWHAVRHRGRYDCDPYNTFEALISCAHRWCQPSAFFFLADRTCHTYDGLYDINDSFIVDLLKRLADSGQEIGLHPSFETWLDAQQTSREQQRLVAACERAGFRPTVVGGRQHFLRWKAPTTWLNWEAAGMTYDSTLCYAERAGFRAGTAREYRAFDLVGSRQLRLFERPLIVMDTTLLDYMQLGPSEQAIQHGLRLKQQCQRLGGNFTLLWHNSNLTSPAHWRVFRTLVEY